ncbi:BrnA antitoxin family protein [Bordetella sp. LUAb4]|uniref:BrnA antitoxin family protein n=1 Tax=Bordetella sp. LUAb4 TaxID=2843195 RepID=UPI00351D2298
MSIHGPTHCPPARSTGVRGAEDATIIRFHADVIQAFKATGRGWQTRINDVLKDWLRTHQPG